MRYENNTVKERKIAYVGGDLEFAYGKFRQLNMLKKLTEEQKRAIYDEMVEGAKAYRGDYQEDKCQKYPPAEAQLLPGGSVIKVQLQNRVRPACGARRLSSATARLRPPPTAAQ